MCLETKFLKLLDISNYVAPGFSYDQFLKANECEQTKGFFLYEWVDGLDKLDETSLPPRAAFYSSLKNANITDEEYSYCQQVWERKKTRCPPLKIFWFGIIIWMWCFSWRQWKKRVRSGKSGRSICLKTVFLFLALFISTSSRASHRKPTSLQGFQISPAT